MAFPWPWRRKSAENVEEIRTPQDLERLLRFGVATVTGEAIGARQAFANVYVYRAIAFLADQVAAAEFKVVQRDGDRWVPAPNHRLAMLMADDIEDGFGDLHFIEWLKAIVEQLGIHGEAFSRIIRVAGRVRRLDFLPTESVSPQTQQNGPMRYRVSLRGGGQVVLPREEIVHFRWRTSDGERGRVPYWPVRNEIAILNAAGQTIGGMFKNGANIGGVLSHPGALSDDAHRRLKESFEERYAGTGNSGKTLILEEGMKFDKTGMTLQEAQAAELQLYYAGRIALAYGVPLHEINDLRRATFSNIEHQSLAFVRKTLEPFLKQICGAMKRDVLRGQRGYAVMSETRRLTQGDYESRSKAHNGMIMSGALSPNEVRAFEGLNPRQGGDEYLTPLNMQPSNRPASETPDEDAEPDDDA